MHWGSTTTTSRTTPTGNNSTPHSLSLPCQIETPSYEPGESVCNLYASLSLHNTTLLLRKEKLKKLRKLKKRKRREKKRKKGKNNLFLSLYILFLSLVVSVPFFLVHFLICLPELPCPNPISLSLSLSLSLYLCLSLSIAQLARLLCLLYWVIDPL